MSNGGVHIAPAKEPSSFRLIMTLGIAGFLSGVILVSIYIFTKPIIAQNKADALQAAVFEVLPNTTAFNTLILVDGNLSLSESNTGTTDEVIYQGLNASGEVTGYAIPGEEGGYQDIIGVLFGFDVDRSAVIGLKVLESKETPGLGDKIFKDADFQSNFNALLAIPEVEMVKKGEKTAGNQIEAITGATISSNAIGRLINKSVDRWAAAISEYHQNQQQP